MRSDNDVCRDNVVIVFMLNVAFVSLQVLGVTSHFRLQRTHTMLGDALFPYPARDSGFSYRPVRLCAELKRTHKISTYNVRSAILKDSQDLEPSRSHYSIAV